MITPEQIKAARLALGLTQKEFGGLLHASLKAVQAWEYGRRNMTGATEALLKIKLEENKMEKIEIQLSEAIEAGLAMLSCNSQPEGWRYANFGPVGAWVSPDCPEILGEEEE